MEELTKLTAKQKRFVEEYLIDLNATQAAIRSGYSVKAARQIGTENIAKPSIAAAIAKATKKVSVITGLTVERTLQELARLAYSDPRKFYDADGKLKPIHQLDDDAAACVAGLEIDEIKADGNVIGYTKKLKYWDKNSALEKSMKYLKMLQPEVAPGPTLNTFIIGENMLEAARRIAFVLSRGSGRIITQKK
jgi:phage terminase small subunit